MAWPTITINLTNLDADTDSPLAARPDLRQCADNVNQIVAARGAVDGICDLDANALVPISRLPAGQPNGVASLDANGLVPTSQLPGGLDAATLGGQPASYYAPASHSHALSDLSDVDTTGAADGQVLALSGGVWTPLSLGTLLGIRVFTSSGTWTRPAGCKKVLVSLRGGGGGGGAGYQYYNTAQQVTYYYYGGNGGKGGAIYGHMDVSAISSVSVTVGGGGAGSNSGNGGGGGATSFGSYMTAYGGGGGGAASASGNGANGADGSATGGIDNGFELISAATSYSNWPGSPGSGEYGGAGNNATSGRSGIAIIWEFG